MRVVALTAHKNERCAAVSAELLCRLERAIMHTMAGANSD